MLNELSSILLLQFVHKIIVVLILDQVIEALRLAIKTANRRVHWIFAPLVVGGIIQVSKCLSRSILSSFESIGGGWAALGLDGVVESEILGVLCALTLLGRGGDTVDS